MPDLLQCQYPINNFWLRLRSRDSVKKIGYYFGVSRETAKRTKFRVQGYMLYILTSMPIRVAAHTGARDMYLDQLTTWSDLKYIQTSSP